VDTLARSEVRYYYEREVFSGVVRMNVPFSTLPSATVSPSPPKRTDGA
jgi:hypothetical protein